MNSTSSPQRSRPGIPQLRRVGQHAALYAQARSEQIMDWLTEELGEDHTCEANDYGRQIDFIAPDGRSITARGHVIASVAVKPTSLLWRWEEGESESVAAAMREWGRQNGLYVFTRKEVDYVPFPGGESEGPLSVAADVGHAAFEIFGADAMYIHPSFNAAGSRLVLLVEDFSKTPPPMDFPTFCTKLPRLLSTVDDVDWSMDGLTRARPDWSVKEIQPMVADTENGQVQCDKAWTITSETGRSVDFHIARDRFGRVTYVNSTISGT